MKAIQILTCISLLLAACGKVDVKPGPPGDAGPQGPPAVRPLDDTASIYGNASLYDELTARWPHFDSIKVTLQWGKDTLSMMTDTAGNYAFHHMETGTYNLTFERKGFGTMKVYSVTHTGGGKLNTQVQPVVMIQRPVRTQPYEPYIEGIDTSSRSGPYFQVFWQTGVGYETLSFVNSGNYQIYISNKPRPGPDNYVALSSSVSPYSTNIYYVAFPTSNLNQYFHLGDSIYVSIGLLVRYRWIPVPSAPGYGTWEHTPLQNISYIDPKTGQWVWPAQGDPIYDAGLYTYPRPAGRASVTLLPHN